jgi:hypothetical protein
MKKESENINENQVLGLIIFFVIIGIIFWSFSLVIIKERIESICNFDQFQELNLKNSGLNIYQESECILKYSQNDSNNEVWCRT